MKAIIFTEYGTSAALQLKEVDTPVPQDDEVLIKVQAASINEWDWAMLRGVPFANRLSNGVFKPKKQVLGADVAGRIAAVGKNITRFRVGDAVFGDICGSSTGSFPDYVGGGFAEFVCVREKALMPKPTGLSFEQAACIPQAGALAVQGLRKYGDIQSGQTVLINGASGGAGTLAVQMAKSAGAEVTGVCRTAKMDLVHSLGADHVIDYTQVDFTRSGRCYDFILDVMAHHSIFASKGALTANGCYVMLGGASGPIFQVMLLGPLISMMGGKKMSILMYKPNQGLDYLVELLECGKVKPVIDRTFPLSETIEAFRYYGDGRAKGKVVITMEQA